MSDHEYPAAEALGTWASIADTPPRDPPGANGHRPPDGDKVYSETDTGNGERLLDVYGGDLYYVKGRKLPWRVWDGNCWRPDETQRVEQWMQGILRSALTTMAGNSYVPRHQLQGQARWLTQSLDMSKIRAGVAAASLHSTTTYDAFDQNPWLLPCANGLTYDVRDGSLRESRRDDMMSWCMPVAASREPVPHPQWDAMLRLVMDEDAEMVDYLRRVLGLCLTGFTGAKCFWFWVGNTNAGKTTVLRVMEELLGPAAHKVALRAVLKRHEDLAIRHDLAEIQGRRFIYAEEFKPGDVLNVGVMKELTGDGTITADRKGEDNETFRVQAKLILGTNEMPHLTDIDDAIRGRVRVLPFPANVPARLAERGERLRSVDEVVEGLRAEAPGILQDLVAAVVEWFAAGQQLAMPEKVYGATKQYFDSEDPLVPWMETCCVADGERVELPFAVWYWSFIEQSGRDPKKATKQWFGRQLEGHGFVKREAYNGKFYTGLSLTDPARVAAEDAKWRDDLKNGRDTFAERESRRRASQTGSLL